ncbi:MAG: peroxide stress protein YaaA [Prolixibacteraceae bacterium]|nr:peroxide stress protein YaaA [Prolixibacteraceae bacterium]MBN2773402.1 peroxide stress protein YaaA [Prolixibacteraceae bacterium]
MILIISPAKKLDFKTPPVTEKYSMPEFLPESEIIMNKLKKLKPVWISKLMGISASLGQVNFERFQNWHLPFTNENAKQAVLAFNGDVYQGLNAETLKEGQFEFIQKHLRILSGLYGVLRPLDLMQPYRLEMGTQFPVGRKKDLYQFWKAKITMKINDEISATGSEYLINLASNEYYKSIDVKKIKAKIITPQFKDLSNGEYKMISFFAKKARGLMVRFIVENKITNPDELTAFHTEGYIFNPRLSEENTPVFTREN